MKKLVFSFVMMLALVAIAGTSAFAQNDATTNASDSRYIMITGSSHTFSVTRTVANSALVWTLVPEAAQTASGTTSLANSDQEYTVVWDQNAAGNYYVQVVETRDGIACANTTRRFYVNLLDFDVWVYASDENGVRLEAGALASCGDGTTANYGNETIGGTTGQAFSNSYGVLNGIVGTAGTDLNNVEGTDGFTQRYITLGITWNTGVNAADAATIAALVNELAFDFSATVDQASLLISVNGVASATGTGSITAERQDQTPSTLAAYPNAVAFTIPMNFSDVWLGATYNDIEYQLKATNVTLRNNDGAGTIRTLGIEPDNREGDVLGIPATTPYANISQQATIQLAPATSTIGVGMN